jgi:filamentous hemagglutinin
VGFFRDIIHPWMALQTKGFLNARQRNRHFAEHGADFGASNAIDYEASADLFLGGTVPSGVHECTRKQGDKLRYDPKTQNYGVIGSNDVIRTFLSRFRARCCQQQ